jgi:membrane protease YdiL (CAAX protease family)
MLAGAGVLIAATALWGWWRDRPLAWLACMAFAYLVGTLLSSLGFALVARSDLTGWTRFAVQRGLYGLLVAAPLAVVLLLGKSTFGPPTGSVGRGWKARSKLFGRNGETNSWRAWLGGLALVAGVPFLILMQVASGFALLSLPWWWVGVAVLMSAVNATAEEFIFRWGMQPAVLAGVGVARGLWLQGLFFGLHHLGLSVSVLATLPGALLVGVGSVVFGKSVVETRGLAWAIAAHMVFDIGIFCAFGAEF